LFELGQDRFAAVRRTARLCAPQPNEAAKPLKVAALDAVDHRPHLVS
jgi:hypothetical protein